MGFSLFYFVDVLLRASEKYFWYDELFTLYLCRLGPASLWQALRGAVDFNPPFFYWVTKVSEALFGENRIGIRLPEVVGFWIFCLCLFRFVSRRLGPLAGFIAMAFPLFTGAFYYAYEARAHGIVLGFAGLSIVCWQMAEEGKRRGLWLALFALCLFGALMTHCYSLVLVFPYALAGLFKTFKTRQWSIGFWAALIAPELAVMPVYVVLLASARRATHGTQFVDLRPPGWFQIPNYYHFLLNPCFLILVFAVLLLSIGHLLGPLYRLVVPPMELILAIGFLALPLVGVLLAKATNTAFFHRYFLEGMVGVCYFLVILFTWSRTGSSRWIGVVFAVVLSISLGESFAKVAWHRIHHVGELLVEPSSGIHIDTTPWNPLANEALLLSATDKAIPIGTADPLRFLYVAHYAPDLAHRLHFLAASEDDWAYRSFRNFARWGPLYNAPETYWQFWSSNPDCYLYGDSEVIWETSELISKGWRLVSMKTAGCKHLALLEHNVMKRS